MGNPGQETRAVTDAFMEGASRAYPTQSGLVCPRERVQGPLLCGSPRPGHGMSTELPNVNWL